MPSEDLKQLILRGLVEWALWNTSEASGWLPYHTVPMEEFFGQAEGGFEAVGERADAYYTTHAIDIVRDVESKIASYKVDDEAKATLSEALQAHEHGLYRASCRVLLPELERVIRQDWLGIEGVRPLTQRDLTASVESWKHRLEDFPEETGDLVLFGWIHSYVFARFETLETRLAPNRHAAAHGWEVYASEQDSLNTIICTDYVYRAVTSLREPNRRPDMRAASPSPAAAKASSQPTMSLDSLDIPKIPEFDLIEVSAP